MCVCVTTDNAQIVWMKRTWPKAAVIINKQNTSHKDDHKIPNLELLQQDVAILREGWLQHEADGGIVAVDVCGAEDERRDLHHLVLADLQPRVCLLYTSPSPRD